MSTHYHATLRRLDGKVYATNFFERITARWGWVVEATSRQFDCREEDVSCDEDDRITVRGVPVATISER